MQEISFIHAADLHLDSPFKGLAHTPDHIFQEIVESTFLSLDKLVAIAIKKAVDFVLIVGDLFDNEKQSLKAQIRLRKAFEELKRHNIEVYLSYGNHDFLNGNLHPVTYPDNVHIFGKETVSHFTYKKGNETLANIYGFSYENRAVTDRKVKEFKVINHDIPFHIATLHGSIQNNTEHDVYAPFQLSELQKEPFDYWGLGHIHKREVLKENPPIVYPGNIQGRNRKETGQKGCYHVVLSGTDSRLTFIPLHTITFQPVQVDLSNCENLHQAEDLIQEAINNDREITGKTLIDLTLTGDSTLKQWENTKQIEDLIEIINEMISRDGQWKYIFHFLTNIKKEKIDVDLKKGEHFLGEVIRQAEKMDLQGTIQDLYLHKRARRYLQSVSSQDRHEIKEEAKELLLNELLK
ncbi:exonuclease SbcCD subunit D [Oceanobacillus sp. Castelsardo]|uniref:metallophosphoesterase family protein n=1 Tax=Oceanobacillus sp. Castelsardo TaxID=1851204 RepID=UPI00083927D1|nr:exonuclease SbcCD subunit D [Oceanobacillus sp. Castelsardo]